MQSYPGLAGYNTRGPVGVSTCPCVADKGIQIHNLGHSFWKTNQTLWWNKLAFRWTGWRLSKMTFSKTSSDKHRITLTLSTLYLKTRSTQTFFLSLNITSYPVWPDVGVKRLPNCFHKLPKVSSAVFTLIDLFQNSPKSQQSFWATFVSEFIAKNFLKSPNLVTLLLSHKCFGYVHAHAWMGR